MRHCIPDYPAGLCVFSPQHSPLRAVRWNPLALPNQCGLRHATGDGYLSHVTKLNRGKIMIKPNALLFCMLATVIGQAHADESLELKTDKDKLSYGIGVSVGRNLRKQDTDVDMNILIKGIETGLTAEKLLFSEKELRLLMNKYQSEVRQKALLSKRLAREDNRKKGEAFLAENKTKEGVVVLPSGVQYKIIKAGNGPKPTDSDIVKVYYRGALLDGTEFDSTDPGHPVDLKASALIAGWKEALSLMPVGSKWQIYIPSELAYGDRGVGSDIGPNETLIFDVELLGIK
jgi:FKBP-type peptidyl-prolyl cis-trans isomerase FklB